MSTKDPILYNHIKQLREKRGWSQQELADLTRISRTGISSIENGQVAPSTSSALVLAKVFHCAVEELFQLEG